ncbi:MAG TPA: SPOR domain-containing protein [Gammaproteobacteria bacterium]|nr:SPOR domain-containing protein [Gammaproteobacteria bacterium]
MDPNIKNRLVGVIVIFALAVIFLPMILDGSGMRKEKQEVVIPPQPLVNANPEFEPKIVELQSKVDALPELDSRFVDENSDARAEQKRSEAAEAPAQTAKASSGSAEQTPAEPEPAPRTGGDSWVLQVGSFQDRDKALAQRDKLRKSNIAAVFIERFEYQGKESYRVRLGPFLNREQTRVAQNKIKAKHDIDGIIMKYER